MRSQARSNPVGSPPLGAQVHARGGRSGVSVECRAVSRFAVGHSARGGPRARCHTSTGSGRRGAPR
eukprot:7610447-Pyramimonas_sp.AAC.1